METFTILSNSDMPSSGFYFKIMTLKQENYKFSIKAKLASGDVAFVYCENQKGFRYVERNNVIKPDGVVYDKTFMIKGIDNFIHFGILFWSSHQNYELLVENISVTDSYNKPINTRDCFVLHKKAIIKNKEFNNGVDFDKITYVHNVKNSKPENNYSVEKFKKSNNFDINVNVKKNYSDKTRDISVFKKTIIPIAEKKISNRVDKFIEIKNEQQKQTAFDKFNKNVKHELLVSVIMPTYNRGNSAVKRIDEIMKQKYKTIEFIIVNDCSDETESYIIEENMRNNKYLRPIKYIKLTENVGVSEALNIGIKDSKGEYVTWISDDNIYYENYVSELVVEDSDFVYSKFKMLKLEKNNTSNVVKEYSDTKDLLYNFSGLGNFMWKRKIMDKIGKYNNELSGVEDFDYLIRTFMLSDKIKFKSEFTMQYVEHGESHFKDKDGIKNLHNLLVEFYLLYLDYFVNREKFLVYYCPLESDYNADYHPSNYYDNSYVRVVLGSDDSLSYDKENELLHMPAKYKKLLLNVIHHKDVTMYYSNNELKEVVDEINGYYK